ncbi:DUF3558 domain-containing protein [Micromonospora sp. C31]|uniref:DUF3558 family protein n=1 Tax=Micromonospora sp. C31 TaxID=2824876 RepID=UPI001B38A183|nr:DUF3558 family protein [Micromonospora sp. C31]MBQ1075436.1 DUF3558 domain-containing protein [Micromonospora sp. C31]
MSANSRRARHMTSRTILIAMVVALGGCSATEPEPSAPSPASPTPDPGAVVAALSRYAGAPCALLAEQELAAYGITRPGRQIHLSEGPARSCYWVTSTGVQMGFIPYPSAKARKSKAEEPTAQRREIRGYPVVQSTDEKSCYQNVDLRSTNASLGPVTFSTLVVRQASDAPMDTCGIATAFTDVVLGKFERLAASGGR